MNPTELGTAAPSDESILPDWIAKVLASAPPISPAAIAAIRDAQRNRGA